MAKYDWIALEEEYILSDYKSVSAFLKVKGINNNGTTRKRTSGWKDKKRQKEDKKATKTIEKVIEKQSENDANTAVKINDVAEELLKKIMEATNQLNIHVDMFGNKHTSIVDRNDVKKLTSALKDLKDIIPQKQEDEEDNSFMEALNGKVEEIWNEEE
nr:MAG TPA: hypothetical protein [Caudoviricetes sp.]